VTEKDSLERIVELARKEGALEGRKLRGFVEALRDRARLILEERVEPLTKRADAFEKEARWRAEIQRGLETRIAALEAEWRTASAAHDRLLAHHRSLVSRVAESLELMTTWLPWSYRRARARMSDLAAALRKELQ